MVYKSGFITFFFLSITTISATLQNPQLLTSTAPKEESSHTAMTSYSEDDGWVEGIEFPKENWIMRVLVIKQMLLILQKVHLESDTALKELYNWYESEEATPEASRCLRCDLELIQCEDKTNKNSEGKSA